MVSSFFKNSISYFFLKNRSVDLNNHNKNNKKWRQTEHELSQVIAVFIFYYFVQKNFQTTKAFIVPHIILCLALGLRLF